VDEKGEEISPIYVEGKKDKPGSYQIFCDFMRSMHDEIIKQFNIKCENQEFHEDFEEYDNYYGTLWEYDSNYEIFWEDE